MYWSYLVPHCYSILDQLREIYTESNKPHNIQIMGFKCIKCIILIMYVVAIQTSITTGLEVDEGYPSEIMKFLRRLQAYRANVFLKPKKDDLNLHGLRRHIYQLSLRRKRQPQPMPIPYLVFSNPIKRIFCDRENNRNCNDMFNFFNRF